MRIILLMLGFFNKDKKINNIFNISTSQLLRLNLKSIYSTHTTRSVIILSPILVAFALAVMFPIWMAIPAGQVFVVPLSAGVVYAMSYYPLKNSTMNNNLKISKVKQINIYTSIIISMFIITFQSELSYWITVIGFNLMHQQGWITFGGTGWILTDMIKTPTIYSVDWTKVEWGSIIYYWVLSTILMFAGSFVFRNMCKTQKTYYLILLVYILSLVGFGNLVPTSYYGVDGNIVRNGSTSSSMMDFNLYQPEAVYAVSCIIPQYHLNVFLMKAMDSGIINKHLDPKYDPTWWNLGDISAFSWSTDWHWNLTLLYPPGIFILLTLVGVSTMERW